MTKHAVSKITSKGQVTIPEEIRRQCHLQAGEQIEWEVTGNGTVQVRKAGASLEELTKILPPKRARTIDQMDLAVGRHLSTENRDRR